MSEQKYTGQLVQHDKTGDVTLMGWNYTGTTRFELPVDGVSEGELALVDNELIYQYLNDKWVLDNISTYSLYMLQQEEANLELITGAPDPVAGIDFSSKPRNEWTVGNWIAHVGGNIRSDHFVTFGSVMAVDMMIQQILKNALGIKKEGISVTFRGGTELQRATLAATVAGTLGPLDVKPGYNLTKFMTKQFEEPLTQEQSAVVMEAISRCGVNIEITADKVEE